MPIGSNPDMFVLTLPLAGGQQGLALFAFIGGFSSATSMIIVEAIALSIMVSNHIVLPIVLRTTGGLGDADGQGVSRLLLNSRRLSIGLILSLGFFYFYLTRDSDALAPIGLISFAGVAQFLPAIVAALFWREASVKGATAAVAVGFVVWAWSMFLPSFQSSSPMVAELMVRGPWGLEWLRPQSLFGLAGLDPLVHSVFWSLFLNSATLIVVSLLTSQSALERLQATVFVDTFRRAGRSEPHFIRGPAAANDLFFVAQRVLGAERAAAIFSGLPVPEREPGPEFIARLERELAGSIGAASAHVMLQQGRLWRSGFARGGHADGRRDAAGDRIFAAARKDLIRAAHTAEKLEVANQQLRRLDQQKDEFLSQVSHEVRTPMTSIRSFSEILLEEQQLSGAERHRFVSTIHDESLRLTKLLDEILDLNALERGERNWDDVPVDPEIALDRAVEVCMRTGPARATCRSGSRGGASHTAVKAELDRLCQVLINLISNAVKYNDSPEPMVTIRSFVRDGRYSVEIEDNGPGIPPADRERIFDMFSRGSAASLKKGANGAGLGLAISRRIVSRLDGQLDLVPTKRRGTCFRVTLPIAVS